MTARTVLDRPPTAGPGDHTDAGGQARGRWGFGHVPALDGLRGAAVAAVLVYHSGHLAGGYLGVDLFFVLSGYLITSLLLAEHTATGTIALGAFWGRRSRRLLPALLALLGGVALYAWFVARPVDLGAIRSDGLATLAYVANWHTILRGSSYWDISLAPSPLQHVWSLAIEEQFYLLWPLVVAGLARRGRGHLSRAVGRVALAGAAVSVALFVGLHHLGASDTRVYEGTDTRATALFLGVALAAFRSGRPKRAADQAGAGGTEALGLLAAAVLVWLWFRLDGQSPWLYRGGLPLASGLAVLVVAAASDPTSPMLGRACSLAPLRWLGMISYGLYLWHWPVFLVIDARDGRLPLLCDLTLRGPVLVGVKLGASLLVAVASYHLVESPIRRGVIRGRPALVGALAGVVVAALLVVVSTAGAVEVADGSASVGQATKSVQGAPVVLFAGDSVAQSVVRPVVADPDRYGVNPVNRTVPGCSIVGQHHEVHSFAGGTLAPAPCYSDASELASIDPDAVFVLLGTRPNDFINAGGASVRACDPAFDQAYRTSTRRALETLRSSGAPVVIGTVLRSGAQAIPVEGSEERISCVDRIIEQLARALPGVHVLDMNELVCPNDPCREEIGGSPIRSDGLHFDNGPGGAAVTGWVVRQVLKVGNLQPGNVASAVGPGATSTTSVAGG
ncbi:MAG: acyltransferase family protein [Acidimicrobiales bacterium]